MTNFSSDNSPILNQFFPDEYWLKKRMKISTTSEIFTLVWFVIGIVEAVDSSSIEVEVAGIPKSKQSLYKPTKDGKWSCLEDPSIILNYSQINDNYCDCPDGSDEPGTSACYNAKFYCKNIGFKGEYIDSFKVADGVCDCCDGSDEFSLIGIMEDNREKGCANSCKELSKEWWSTLKSKKNIIEKGLKEKQVLIKKTKQIIENKRNEITRMEEELEKLRINLINEELKAENNKNEHEDENENENEYESGIEVIIDIKKLNEGHDTLKGYLSKQLQSYNKLVDLLNHLKENYNKNVNDVAVVKAVNDWEALLSKTELDHIPSLSEFEYLQEKTYLEEEVIKLNSANEEEGINKDRAKDNILQTLSLFKKIPDLLLLTVNNFDVNYLKPCESILEALSLDYNPNFNDGVVKSTVREWEEYLGEKDEGPNETELIQESDLFVELIDSFEKRIKYSSSLNVKQNENNDENNDEENEKNDFVQATEEPNTEPKSLGDKFFDFLNDLLNSFLGIPSSRIISNPSSSDSSNPSKSSKSSNIQDLESQISNLEREINESENDLDDTDRYGPLNILRALEDKCIEKHISGYDYKLCFLNDLRQTASSHNSRIGNYNRVEFLHSEDDIIESTESILDLPTLRLFYNDGQKCWNGPPRSGIIDVYCGESDEILSVMEEEKCTYGVKIKSPIGCLDQMKVDIIREEKEMILAQKGNVLHDEL